MGAQVGFYIAKFIGKLKREKYKETLNRWLAKQGLHFVGGRKPDTIYALTLRKMSLI